MEEKRYTLPEARAEIARRECARDGHAPFNAVKKHSSFVALFWMCECGAIRWTPEENRT